MPKLRKIGILGGTFNPVHLGHLALAEQARQLLDLDKIVFVPVNLPPVKKIRRLASAKDRYHMLRLALTSHPPFILSNLEIKRKGVSYSFDTVRTFTLLFPKAKLYFITGADALKDFCKWKNIHQIDKICTIVVASRLSHPLKIEKSRKKALPQNIKILKINALNISSSDIRRRIKRRQDISHLVPEQVERYIAKRKLYL